MKISKELDTSLLHTTGTKIKLLNERLGIRTIQDMLDYFPRDYEDLSKINKIKDFTPGITNVTKAVIGPIKSERTRNGKNIQKANITDENGDSAECVWFGKRYLKDMFMPGEQVLVSGKLKFENGKKTFMSPEIEKAHGSSGLHAGRVVPIYAATEGVSAKWIREKMIYLKPFLKEIQEWLPQDIIQKEKLISRSEAYIEMHFPSDIKKLMSARKRMAFEEVFLLQLIALLRRQEFQKGEANEIKLNAEIVKKFIEIQPFDPTNAQKISLYQILNDMEKSVPMVRLLQGDVGSGKTFVAVAAAVHTVLADHQVAFLAPTEILARQHYQKIKEQLHGFKNIKIELLIGSISEKEKQRIKAGLESGEINFVVGTHALITKDVSFKNIALAIVDEQHRFGVEQREKLTSHGSPHLLAMSATPIPRSLALVLFGDTDVSVINEMPPGRKPILTKLVSSKNQIKALHFIEQEVRKGHQAFFVYPLINESEAEMMKDVKSAIEQHKSLKEFYPDFKVEILHGKMKVDKKKKIMQDFQDGKIDVLVSTAVIEVGVDIPNATIMVIEGAERFGLAQLHQFRGRVGRGGEKSYCFLFASSSSPDSLSRLRALEKTNDGFELSEIDLKLRGPGEFFGTRQSGLPDLKMANMLDARLIAHCRKLAEEVLEKDPKLKNNTLLKQRLEEDSLKNA